MSNLPLPARYQFSFFTLPHELTLPFRHRDCELHHGTLGRVVNRARRAVLWRRNQNLLCNLFSFFLHALLSADQTSSSAHINYHEPAERYQAMFFCASHLDVGIKNVKALKPDAIQADIKSRALPSPRRRAEIVAVLDRYKRLTLVKQLSEHAAQDKWTKVPKEKLPPDTPYPHRVWRPIAIAESGKSKVKKTLHRFVSPAEFYFIPLMIEKWSACTDGELLEIIERFRAHMYAAFKNEVKFKQARASLVSLAISVSRRSAKAERMALSLQSWTRCARGLSEPTC